MIFLCAQGLVLPAEDKTPGFIIASKMDGFDRPVCFAFKELGDLLDGSEIQSNEIPVEQSINYKLARDGLVYPPFYEGLETEIMDKFRSVNSEARADSRGIWSIDRTSGFTLWNTRTIEENVIILPKLFRRFVAFFLRRSKFEEFIDYLKSNKDPVKLSDGTPSNLHELLDHDDQYYGLTVKPLSSFKSYEARAYFHKRFSKRFSLNASDRKNQALLFLNPHF